MASSQGQAEGAATSLQLTGACSKSLQVDLDAETGKTLRARVAELVGSEVKLLCKGRTLENCDQKLSERGVKPGDKVLVLKAAPATPSSPSSSSSAPAPAPAAAAAAPEETAHARVARIVAAAESMARRQDGGRSRHENYYFELNDQNGKPVDLPADVRKALSLGLLLHDQGRRAMERGGKAEGGPGGKEAARPHYEEALEIFQHADSCFRECPHSIVNAIDNPAYLCLDIVWAYWKLGDRANIASAKATLDRADAGLRRAHGPGMERLLQVKGICGEMALYVRLRALQGVAAFLQGDLGPAKRYIAEADQDAKRFSVSDESLAALLALGFSPAESRRALRAASGHVNVAAEKVLEERGRREAARREEAERRRRRDEEAALGRTASGLPVDAGALGELVAMGFPRRRALRALRAADNGAERAMEILLAEGRGGAAGPAAAGAAEGSGSGSGGAGAAAEPPAAEAMDAEPTAAEVAAEPTTREEGGEGEEAPSSSSEEEGPAGAEAAGPVDWEMEAELARGGGEAADSAALDLDLAEEARPPPPRPRPPPPPALKALSALEALNLWAPPWHSAPRKACPAPRLPS
eukprot:tig00000455_g1020.t1